MNIYKKMVAVIASLLLVNGAYAANKTGVTDLLSSGDSRLDMDYSNTSLSAKGSLTSGGTSYDVSGKSAASQLNGAYWFGLTDRLNMGITLGLVKTSEVETTITNPSTNIVLTSKYEGAANSKIDARYLMLDKENGNMGLVIYGRFRPASSASDKGVSEVKSNGVVSTAGVTGKSAYGYATTNIGILTSAQVELGEVFVDLGYQVYGEYSNRGEAAKPGSAISLEVGLERKLIDTTRLRARLGYASIGSSYSGTTLYSPETEYLLGLEAIIDISKSMSLNLNGGYVVSSPSQGVDSNGDKSSISTTGYTLGLRGMFFF